MYSQKFETLMISSYISYPTDIFFLISDGLQLVGDIVPTLIGEQKITICRMYVKQRL